MAGKLLLAVLCLGISLATASPMPRDQWVLAAEGLAYSSAPYQVITEKGGTFKSNISVSMALQSWLPADIVAV